MQMQADTYGWQFRMEVPPVEKHKPCLGWSHVTQLALMFVLVMLLAAKASAVQNFDWTFDVPPVGPTTIRYTFRIEPTELKVYVRVHGTMTYTGSSFVDVAPVTAGHSPGVRRFSWTHATAGPFDAGEQSFSYTAGLTEAVWAMNGLSNQTVYYQASSYYWDGTIPANTTDRPIIYRFYQNGTLITSYTQAGGAGAQTVHLTGLPDNSLVTVIAETGGWQMTTGEPPVPEWVDSVNREVVGGGTPTNAIEPPPATFLLQSSYATSSSNAPQPTAPTPAPVAPTSTPTPTAAPTAPATQAPKAAPTRPAPPFPTPSGTGGASKADLEASTNAIVDAMGHI